MGKAEGAELREASWKLKTELSKAKARTKLPEASGTNR